MMNVTVIAERALALPTRYMKIAVITFGTEGDTRPLAALCKGLADAGHHTCLLTEKSSVRFATSAVARPVALACDIKSSITELLSSRNKASGASAMTEALSSIAKTCTADWMRSLLEVASGCDSIIAGGLPIYVALSVSEYLGIPMVGAGLQRTSRKISCYCGPSAISTHSLFRPVESWQQPINKH
jgi:sterol 3beta-glucosyltransferase